MATVEKFIYIIKNGIVNLFFSFDEFSHSEAFWGSFMQILHGDSPKKRLFFPTF